MNNQYGYSFYVVKKVKTATCLFVFGFSIHSVQWTVRIKQAAISLGCLVSTSVSPLIVPPSKLLPSLDALLNAAAKEQCWHVCEVWEGLVIVSAPNCSWVVFWDKLHMCATHSYNTLHVL